MSEPVRIYQLKIALPYIEPPIWRRLEVPGTMTFDALHEIKVGKVSAPEPGVQYPRCTGGEHACPPEDCGGFPGYLNLLETLANPKHPEREEMLEWIGGEWNPETFDIDAVNAKLKPRTRKAAKTVKRK